MSDDDPTSELGEPDGTRTGGSPEPGASARSSAPDPSAPPGPAPPSNIGPYRLLRRIGEGGMGDVWLAEQTEPVRRTVALKLLRGGMYDSSLLPRFAAERQTLALMEHPSIAKFFDAGSTGDGQPYFVMEYVDGEPLTRWCDTHRLGIEARLRLFAKVCEGVQHAHTKAIIHRDLKPSNVLVTLVDGEPAPRIIDFGIAKAVAAGEADRALFTRAGAILGTIGYMSPEQADPRGADIDTRTDVYSLGVILYELLTGRRPFETRDRPLDEVLRRLREDDPPPLTTSVSARSPESAETAARRGVELRQLASLLKGDLDSIVRKALARDRERRYGTPAELAADIRRHLESKPVEARPATVAYRFRKYVRRHKIAAAMVALFLLAGAGVTIAQAVQLRRTARERERADRIARFMTDIFAVVDPSEARGRTITAREVLDRAAGEIARGTEIDPFVRSGLTLTIAKTYLGLGLASRAESLVAGARPESVVAGARAGGDAATPARDRDALRLAAVRGIALSRMKKLQEGDAILRKTLDAQVAAFGADDPDALQTRAYVGESLESLGRYGEAEKEMRESLRLIQAADGAGSARALDVQGALVRTLGRQNRLEEAEALARSVVADAGRVLGPEHPMAVSGLNSLGWVLLQRRKLPDAEAVFRDALERSRRTLGPEHPNTMTALVNLAAVLHQQSEFEEALAWAREGLEINRRVGGEDAPATLLAYEALAVVLGSTGRQDEALEMLRRVVDGRRRVFGDSLELQHAVQNLAFTYSYAGRHAEAQPLYRESIRVAEKLEDPTRLSNAWLGFAMGSTMAGARDAAFDALRRALDAGPGFVLQIEALDDLKPLRGDPRYDALVREIRARKPAA